MALLWWLSQYREGEALLALLMAVDCVLSEAGLLALDAHLGIFFLMHRKIKVIS